MRLSRFAPWLTAIAVVLLLGVTTLGRQSQQDAAPQANRPEAAGSKKRSEVIRPVRRDSVPAADSVLSFQDPTPLKLTLEQLRSGPGVLLRNPEAERRSVRLAVVDSLESMPLSRVLIVDTNLIAVRRGVRTQPGMALVSLSAAPNAERLPPGDYFGYLVAESRDSLPQAVRRVQVTVPQPATMKAVDSAWTAEVFKLALLPGVRATASENSELRCGADRRPRGDGIIPHGWRRAVGTCVRDNQLPVTITGPWVALPNADSAAEERGEKLQKVAELSTGRPRGSREPRGTASQGAARGGKQTAADAPEDSRQAQPRRQSGLAVLLQGRPLRKDTLPTPRVLLGVLQQKDSADRAMVWWTGTPVRAGGEGGAGSLELYFTSLDRPGEYSGTVDLAPIGGTGTVRLRVRVTHDWPVVLLAIALGVFLSAWLRDYVRTRRAVLQVQARAAELVSRIEQANEQLRQVDSDEAGYLEYPVDETLLTRLRTLERQLQQHAYDGVVLEPGKTEHDTIRSELNACEQDVEIWERLAEVLGELRVQMLTATDLEEELRPDEIPVLLAEVERLFDGKRLATAEITELTVRARSSLDAVRCWNEVARNASLLKKTLADAAPDAEGRTGAEAALEAALVELWASADADAAKRVGSRVAAAGKLYKPARFKLPVPVFPFGWGKKTAAGQDAPGEPPLDGVLAPAPTEPGADGTMSRRFRLPVEGGTDEKTAVAQVEADSPELRARNHAELKRRQAKREEHRQKAQQRRDQAESRRRRNERRYYWVTLGVAAVTGLNQLYFKDGGFGQMQDYMVALLWGFGTKMGLDTVRTAVESGRLPFMRDGAAAPTQGGSQQSSQQQSGAQQTSTQQSSQQQTGTQSTTTQTGGSQQTSTQQNASGAGATQLTAEQIAAAAG